MKRQYILPAVASMACLLSSCLDDDSMELADNYVGNFEACWQTFDQRYCFFEEKGIDWDAIHAEFRPEADTCRSSYQLLDILDRMLDRLQDGHVNVYAPFNTARYWGWYEDYEPNFDAELVQRHYLGTHYSTASGISYGVFSSDSVAYLRYASFANPLGDTNLDYALALMQHHALGLIIDIRDNGGGDLTNVPKLADRFATRQTCYGYIQHKTGAAHNAFSQPEPLYLNVAPKGRISWDASTRPVVVLANRNTFSAANNFVQAMRALNGDLTTDTLGVARPKIIRICGDRTGGGSGMPFESVLPNGWPVRFSACPISDPHHRSTEAGIDPDIVARLDSTAAFTLHVDSIIETARLFIVRNTLAPRRHPADKEKK